MENDYTYDYGDSDFSGASRLGSRKTPRLQVDYENPHWELLYAIHMDSREKVADGRMTLSVWRRDLDADGAPAGPVQAFHPENSNLVSSDSDAVIMSMLLPLRQDVQNRYVVPQEKISRLFAVLPLAQQLRILDEAISPRKFARIFVDSSVPRHIKVEFAPSEGGFTLTPFLSCSEKVPLTTWKFYWPGGYLLADSVIYRLAPDNAESCIVSWLRTPPTVMSETEIKSEIRNLMLGTLLEFTNLPQDFLQTKQEEILPIGILHIRTAKYLYNGKEQLHADLLFDYAGTTCSNTEKCQALTERKSGRIIQRNPMAEDKLERRLLKLGFRDATKKSQEEPGLKLTPAKLPAVVETLTLDGWIVTAEGKTYRRPVERKISIVASGSRTDWFEVDGGFDFGGQTVPFPRLLMACRNGAKSIRLDDGTYGILPQDWLLNYTALTELGEISTDNSKILFRKQQAALVAALLDQRKIDADKTFGNWVKNWHTANARQATPMNAPAGISATLRPYQKEGLGWLVKMQDSGIGGCLADDMGLGKTLQVLSMLQHFKNIHGRLKALVVMPSTLLFNWQNETEKFAPSLTTSAYFGPRRQRLLKSPWDILFTTYGVLRQDGEKLAAVDFDYVVLDEAQAIKNADSQTAKAARCLNAIHRLTMTGTPIENSISELFSQLEFLNPGLFGAAFVRNCAKTAATLRSDALGRLRKYLAPFLLRRKKEDVAKDLPPKTEQVIWCELQDSQRDKYQELKEFYQAEFADDETAQKRGADAMLQALLRLRQAACHTALLNPADTSPSAKLDLLEEYLENIVASGHKALIFSQFTSFLHLAENSIRKHDWKFCYLDGQTKDRKSLVEQFQNDPDTKLFLISLKAGGTGLNLTAADYVFILDPWWNPAAEAQAIDRAYRIGQTNPVFAYKIIARNTVEEKIHNLQISKQFLADNILANTSKNANLSADDLKKILRSEI